MKRTILIVSVLFCGLIIFASVTITQFYLSELDFISNHPVPEREVVNKKHIKAEFDNKNNILKKFIINPKGEITLSELFSYDTTETLKRKDVYSSNDVLQRQVLFGMEEKAVSYIEYVYGVDSVKNWTDRFSILDFNESLLVNHHFYDINAFRYGHAEFEYDSTGRLTREAWVRHPSGRTMRVWNKLFDPITQLTRIMEYDSNGVLVQDIQLSPDGTESIFLFTELKDSLFINHTNLRFNNISFLEWGSLIWYEVDSNGNYLDSVQFMLPKNWLGKGTYDVDMNLDSVLKDSTNYDLVFSGKGRSGYDATKRSVVGLTYDISPPILSIYAKPFINQPMIQFDQSEPIVTATLIWEDLFDSTGSVIIEFDSLDFAKTGTGLFRPVSQMDLNDSTFYRISFMGMDRAGNKSSPAFIDSIFYDIRPPTAYFTSPIHGEYRNISIVEFTIDEPIQSWNIAIRWMGGESDMKAPYFFQSDSSMFVSDTIRKDLKEEFHLHDGTMYSMEINVVDRAGNSSKPSSVDSVTYDITPPLLTIIYPATKAAVNTATISYSNNEPLQAGEFRWEQTEGTKDSSAPHIIPIMQDELLAGDHIQVLLAHQTELTDGAVYSLIFSGKDLAGNDGIAPSHTEILYDAIPPEFTDILPLNGDALNHKAVSYTLSERIETGTITWVRTSGSEDPNSPHLMELIENEKETGVHDSITISMTPNLMDGSEYRVEFNGTDRAGNVAESILIDNILYDFTRPEIHMIYPQENTFLPTVNMTYELSEKLEEGEFLLDRTGGNLDPEAPHKITLNQLEKSGGMHNNIRLRNMPNVLEGTEYTLSFSGKDRAKNAAPIISLSGIQYDFTPPVITINSPTDSSHVNHLKIDYHFNEIMSEAYAVWERIGGVDDPTEKHIQPLVEAELDSGYHEESVLVNPPNLVDGAIYSISISGLDRAGNESNIPVVNNILYDITLPVITLMYPKENSYVPTPAISYTLSENLFKGTITYVQISGQTDTLSPQDISMDKRLRRMGNHENIFEENGPHLTEGSKYSISISGRDRAGNRASVANVTGVIYDATPPVFTIQTPDSSLAVNHIGISFSKSEDLLEGEITWMAVGGKEDLYSPHVSKLVEPELTKGIEDSIIVVNGPPLNDGTVYSISVNGKDFAGNVGETAMMENVLYDITPPQLRIVSPKNNHYTNGSELTFLQSEDLIIGIITWEGLGETGEKYSVLWELPNHVLLKGEYELNDYHYPDLKDGGDYTIRFSGRDPAGNEGVPVEINHYKVDRTPPVFSNIQPVNGSYVNTDHVGYTLSEDIGKGDVVFNSKHDSKVIPLADHELLAGEHSAGRLMSQMDLTDGEKYSIIFTGADFAGNHADSIVIQNVTYDISPPELTVVSPDSNSVINHLIMDISINEPLLMGTIFWETNTGFILEENLETNQRTSGKHRLSHSIQLVEQIPYKTYFRGKDLAGNEGSSNVRINIIYDITPPVLMIHSPLIDDVVNHTQVSYSLSEKLLKGKMMWQDLSGNDPNPTHESELNKDERLSGVFNNIDLSFAPELTDGSNYALHFEGKDLAGNIGEADAVSSFKYDITLPKFSKLNPESGSLINEVNVDYTVSENLASGKIVFTHIAGTDDPDSPHVVNLVGSRLNEGKRGGKIPESLVKLTNGAVYNIEFYGEDFAGNNAEKTVLDSIRFDNEPPVVIIKSPVNNIVTNSLLIDYFLSENIEEGEFKISIKDGEDYTLVLDEEGRLAGDHVQFNHRQLSELIDGIELSITLLARDEAGNKATPFSAEKVKYDTTRPNFLLIRPQTNNFINYTALDYELSENIQEAFVTVTQIGGVFDSRSPMIIKLTGKELKKGNKENVNLNMGLVLENGSIYSFKFSGADYAGNKLISPLITNIFYDNESPVLSISKPVDSEQIKNTKISYVLNDNLSKGIITFKQTGGTSDPNSPHIVHLEGANLRQGVLMDIDMELMDLLADGSRYSISLQGWDKAGNASEIVIVRDVLFDIFPPKLAINKPVEGSAFNEPIISFEMNEKLAEGTFMFTQTGGIADSDSPHEVTVLPPFNTEGRHDGVTLANDLTLQDGSVYMIEFNAKDPAGNVSDPVRVKNVLYDISPPTIIADDPQSGSYLQNILVAYSVDEPLSGGEITVERTLGTADPLSPHIIELNGIQLNDGRHEIAIHEVVNLISGAEYSLIITGKDRAGNDAIPGKIGQLMYDVEPPILSLESPATGQKVNHKIIGFRVGEKLQTLSVSWINSQGKEMGVDLSEQYLLPDTYNQVVIPNPPDLKSGEMYRIKLTGTDLAGNMGGVTIEDIEYDDTPPAFTKMSPKDNAFQNNAHIAFSISEPLKSGKITWRSTGETTDSQSPRLIILSQTELSKGLSVPRNLINQTPLQDGAVYELSILGEDLAGNTGETVLARNIQIDTSPPTIRFNSPNNNAYVNNDNVEYSLSEPLQSAEITWRRVGGEIDPIIHTINLNGGQLKKGDHGTLKLPQIPLVNLVDYQIEITGLDLAGNQTAVPEIRKIYYDISPPILTLTEPQNGSSVSHQNIAYTISEPLKSGLLQFTNQKTGAVSETRLSGDELTNLHWDYKPLNLPLSIEDGGTYTYKLLGTDYAGNKGESAEIKDVKYDISKPVFTITIPKENNINIESKTTYSLNENIVSGTATWVRTGGKTLGAIETANKPQILELTGSELEGGDHNNIYFTNLPQLNTTTIYKLTLQGVDAAGNESLPTSIDGIEYIPAIEGNWFFQGAIMTVVWIFEPDENVVDQSKGKFSQGMQMGTKISNQEFGRYTIDFSSKPWSMEYSMKKSGQTRFSIFEFRDNEHMKVLTKDRSKPKNWRDGEIMLYEKR